MSDTFNCLACGRLNPVRGANYSNKYCNNKCQQFHRRHLLEEKRIDEWKSGCGLYVWKQVPDYIKYYLIRTRGHRCETCGNEHWMNDMIPLLAVQRDRDVYNNKEDNLELVCPNCNSVTENFIKLKENLE